MQVLKFKLHDIKAGSRKLVRTILLSFICPALSFGQSQPLTFEQYNPVSTLVVPEHLLSAAKFPFIDIHNHQPYMENQDLNKLVNSMDAMNMKVMINLSGKGGDALKQMTDNVKKHQYTDRIVIFTNVNFKGFGESNWTRNTLQQLEKDFKNGAKGLKVFKELGLTYKDEKGNRIAVDDPRLDPIWHKCAEYGWPVLIHSAAPKSFWDPMDDKNERWLEMYKHADRQYMNLDASWQQIIDEQHRMFRKHPKTKFINAHFGWLANDLAKLSLLMDELPNMYVEFGAVIAELGRQPTMARNFFEKYQDRILFGKDSWVPSEYDTYFRVLETSDEYFPYHKKYHAHWNMYGMGLSDDILKKVYYKNALTLLPGIKKSLFPD